MVESFPSAPLQHHPCSRRSLLEIGTAGTLGLSLPQLLAARSIDSSSRDLPCFGKARSCIVVFLFGGPSQQDLWDLKPETSSDIRGEFSPIDTVVPGMQIGELLPHLAQEADHFSLIRSMSHRDFEHGSASYSALTGQPHPRPGTNTPARPEDFPTYGSVVSKLRPTSRPSPNFVVLGPVMHQGNRPPMAGQNAGFLGSSHEAFRIAENPNLSSLKSVHWRQLNRFRRTGSVAGNNFSVKLIRMLTISHARLRRKECPSSMNGLFRCCTHHRLNRPLTWIRNHGRFENGTDVINSVKPCFWRVDWSKRKSR